MLLLKKNTEGLPVDFVLSRQTPDENGHTYIDRFAEMEPSDSRTKQVYQPAAVVVDNTELLVGESDGNLRQFFVPIGPNDGEIRRSVPELVQ